MSPCLPAIQSAHLLAGGDKMLVHEPVQAGKYVLYVVRSVCDAYVCMYRMHSVLQHQYQYTCMLMSGRATPCLSGESMHALIRRLLGGLVGILRLWFQRCSYVRGDDCSSRSLVRLVRGCDGGTWGPRSPIKRACLSRVLDGDGVQGPWMGGFAIRT